MSQIEIRALTKRISDLEQQLQTLTADQQIRDFNMYQIALGKASGNRLNDIVVLTLCINYADKLRISLKKNSHMFKHIYVITVKEDIETQTVCQAFTNVRCILTDKIHHDNAVFNKSAMIHEGQSFIHNRYPNKWVLLLDADIVLPRHFCKLMQVAGKLDKQTLYSMQRVDFHKHQDFKKFRNYVHYKEQFVGYFQLYFDKTKFYPTSSKNCAECDLVFRDLFPVKKYINQHDYIYHLGQDGVNWNGRVSEQWK